MPRSRLFTSTTLPFMLRGMAIPHAPDEEGAAGGETAEPEGAAEGEEGGEGAEGGGEAPEGEEGAEGGEPAAAAAGDDEGAEEPKKRIPWQVKRIGELTAREKAANERADALAEENRALKALGVTGAEPPATTGDPPAAGGFTDEEVNRRATAIAETRVLNEKVDVLYDQVVALDPKFVERQPALREAFANVLTQRPDFWEAMTQLPNGAAVFNALSKDLDHLDEVLGKSGVGLGLELAAISARLAPKGASVSRAGSTTRPITPVTEQGKGEMALDDPKLPKEEYQRRRAEAREARYNGQ